MAQWSEDKAAKLIAEARAAKEASDDIYRDAVELVFPDREGWTAQNEGAEKNTVQWDSTAQVSLIRAANRLSSDFTPSTTDWFEIGLGPAAQQMPDGAFQRAMGRDKESVKAELERTTSIVQAVMNAPGFPTAANELYLDWHIGQGGMKIMPNDDIIGEPVVFSSMPISHFYAKEGPNGRLDQWYMWHTIRADTITAEWSDAEMPDELMERAKRDKPPMVKLCSVVYRDYDERRKPFRYEVFWQHGRAPIRIVQRQSRTSPFVTPRYSKLSGENRGRGPALFALADIRTANKIVELTLRGAAIAVSGIYTATEDGVIGKVNLKPYSVIKVRSNGGPSGPSLQRLDTNAARIDFGNLLIEQLHENIKKIIGDNSLPPEAGPIRTATEFVQRARELISDQAGGLGRLHAEFIIPAVQRVVDILETKGILQTDGLHIDQFLVEVRMTSPLAKGQSMGEVENLVRFIELLKTLGGDQLAMLEINVEEAVVMLGDLMDIPMSVRNTGAQKAQIKKAGAALMASQMGGDPAAAGAAMDMEAQDNA